MAPLNFKGIQASHHRHKRTKKMDEAIKQMKKGN